MAREYLLRRGARIRARRDELGLTQEEVARRMPGNKGSARISKWEHGVTDMHPQNLEELAAALETTVERLLADGPTGTNGGTGSDETPEQLLAQELADLRKAFRQLEAAVEKRLPPQEN